MVLNLTWIYNFGTTGTLGSRRI